MSYIEAIEATGAVVHVSKDFGDYQGTTWAKITHNGITGWVSWDFGSCSYCDSYERMESDTHHRLGLDCGEPIPKDELAKFGEDYVSHIKDQEAAETEAGKDAEWDSEAESVLAFLRENAIPHD